MAVSDYPDFVIVCDHGVAGGPPDPVGRYAWDDGQGVWVSDGNPIMVWDRDSKAWVAGTGVAVTYLEGDCPGWWHRDRVDTDGAYHPAGQSRAHHEMVCPREQPKDASRRAGHTCHRRRYRADTDDIQTVLSLDPRMI